MKRRGGSRLAYRVRWYRNNHFPCVIRKGRRTGERVLSRGVRSDKDSRWSRGGPKFESQGGCYHMLYARSRPGSFETYQITVRLRRRLANIDTTFVYTCMRSERMGAYKNALIAVDAMERRGEGFMMRFRTSYGAI
jgi:hypothetical protein